MPENKSSSGEEFLGGCFLFLVLGVLGIAVMIIQALVEFGKIIIEGALITFPILGIGAWIVYKIETSFRPSEPAEKAMRLLNEAKERAVPIFLGSGGIALLSFFAFLAVDSSSGERAAMGWLVMSGTACLTYSLVLFRHQEREEKLKTTQRNEKELEKGRQLQKAAGERERRRQRLAERLADIRLFLEDHYFEGALLALDELEQEYPEEALAISLVRRQVKDAELAYHKARIEPHIWRLDSLLHHLDQMKQVKSL